MITPSLKWLEQDFANDDFHRTELLSRVDLETDFAGISRVVVHFGDLPAVEPNLNVVTLGTDLHRIPVVSVYYRLVPVHRDEHFTGTVK
jgi:hypothetical protein